MGTLVFRVDANPRIGTGHFMRCFALAQAWKDKGGDAIFITACRNEGLLQRLRYESFGINIIPESENWAETGKMLDKYPDSWVVLDGYHFNETYQQQVKEAGHRLLVIDDMAHLKHYYADVVLNQNLHAELLHYSCEPYTQLLLGTKYVLLRREFQAWKGWKRKIPAIARHVLVTLGGADPGNYTLKVIQALQRVNLPGLEATVVIGGSNVHGDTLQAEIGRSSLPVRLIRDAADMPELMAWADVAVVSGGATVWELAFMGVPSIVGITAQIEEFLVEGLKKYRLFSNVGWFKTISIEQLKQALYTLIQDEAARRNMVKLGQRLVDGNGCDKIISKLLKQKAR